MPTSFLLHLHAINTISGIGPTRMQALLDTLGTPEQIWNASTEALQQAGLSQKIAEQLIAKRKTSSPEALWSEMEKHSIQALHRDDPNYPMLLKEIPQAPFIIYTRGSISLNAAPLVTIVGSRRHTPYGKRVADRLARDLAAAGICVVSGLALGIDGVAHRGALEAGGTTVAVLGNSLDDASIAPRSHLSLAHSVIHHGALVSEYPPVTAANRTTFPARNRIMAGMSLGSVIVEAAEKSGTLITARMTLDFNREVFAVPGSIFSEASLGPNRLIRSGAKVITSVSDILEELSLGQTSLFQAQQTRLVSFSPEEEKIMHALSGEPLHIDKIVKMTTLDTSIVGSTLAFLELKGMVKNIGGMNYVRM